MNQHIDHDKFYRRMIASGELTGELVKLATKTTATLLDRRKK